MGLASLPHRVPKLRESWQTSPPASEALKPPEGPLGCGPLSLRLCWLFRRPEGHHGYQGDMLGTPLGPGGRAAAAACLWHPDGIQATPRWLRLRSWGMACKGYNLPGPCATGENTP